MPTASEISSSPSSPGHCQETLDDVTQRWERRRFEETRELDRACDGMVQQLKTDASDALAQLRNDAAASNSSSPAPSSDVLACEGVLEELRATPALAPHELVNSDTGIESLGILTEGQRTAHIFLQEGRAPLHATPNGLLLGHVHGYEGPPLRVGADLSMMELADCAETDVLLLEPGRYYALVSSDTYLPAGSIAEFEWEEDSETWHRRPQRDGAASVPPALPAMEAHEGKLRRLFDALPEIEALLEYVIGGVGGRRVEKSVISESFISFIYLFIVFLTIPPTPFPSIQYRPLVADAVPEGPLNFELLPDLPDRSPSGAGLAVVLVVGRGQHEALLNQACAKQELMGVNNQGRILVFAEDEATAALARALGYRRVVTHPVFSRSEELGTSTAEERAHTSWLRLLAAWLMVRRGADALIHGVEFVWLRHWSHALTDGGALDSWRHDFAFMPTDDNDAASRRGGGSFPPAPSRALARAREPALFEFLSTASVSAGLHLAPGRRRGKRGTYGHGPGYGGLAAAD